MSNVYVTNLVSLGASENALENWMTPGPPSEVPPSLRLLTFSIVPSKVPFTDPTLILVNSAEIVRCATSREGRSKSVIT